jgi:hypothetical protein
MNKCLNVLLVGLSACLSALPLIALEPPAPAALYHSWRNSGVEWRDLILVEVRLSIVKGDFV